MPALAALTLNGLSGADHVFAPYGIDAKGVATLIAPGTAPVGDEVLTFSSIRAPNGGKTKTTLKLKIPKTQDVTVGGVVRPTVVKTAYAEISITTDATATLADRQEIFALVCSALTLGENPQIVAGFQESLNFY
jgi:hypothetical protein